MFFRKRTEEKVDVEQFSNLPKIVWLAGSPLTNYQELLREFDRYKESTPRRSAFQAETTFHVWSKAGDFSWQSDKTILVSIQTTVDFANYLSDKLGTHVTVTDKKN